MLRLRLALPAGSTTATFIEEGVNLVVSVRDRLLLGEEGGAREGTSGLTWVVDPIDGTSNFAWGMPLFGVMAGIVSRGQPLAGLIYDPVGRD